MLSMTKLEGSIDPGLSGVPETMLWTLHNRAVESMRPDGVLQDAEVERIYKSIDYDYESSFRAGEPSHSMRSIMFDRYVSGFLAAHPDAVVVNLGVGLETQRFRIDNERALWIGVDLPEAIAVRERFIAADDRHRHVAADALHESWYDEVPDGRPLFITAQGLLMYFEEAAVKQHLVSLSKRFPGAWYAFDTIPRLVSKLSLKPGGFKLTDSYAVPPCPWGANRNELQHLLRSWMPTLGEVILDKWDRYPRGFVRRYLLWLISSTPGLRGISPTVSRVHFGA